MDTAAFRDWLAQQIARETTKPDFRLQRRITELEAAHDLTRIRLAQRVRDAEAVWQRDGHGAIDVRLAVRERGLTRAIERLTVAVVEGRADPGKLAACRAEHEEVTAHRARLAASPAGLALRDAVAARNDFDASIGLSACRAELDALDQVRGHRSVRSGQRSEDEAKALIEARLGNLLVNGSTDERPDPDSIAGLVGLDDRRGPLTILSGLTLEIARSELDLLIVSETEPPDEPFLRSDGPRITAARPVTVHAVIEVKRNPNDVVHGFRMRQENLAFLTDDIARFDPEAYRSVRFPLGRFDRAATHQELGRTWTLTRESFRHLRRSGDGPILAGLWFVTRKRPLDGVTGRERARLLRAVATDPTLDLDSGPTIERLHRFARRMVDRFQTRDVLTHYLGTPALARQIVFLPEAPPSRQE